MKNSPGCDIIENNIQKNYIYMYSDDNSAKNEQVWKMKRISVKLRKETTKVNLPDNTEILSAEQPKPLSNPAFFIQNALVNSIGSPSLDKIIEQKLKKTQKQRQ